MKKLLIAALVLLSAQLSAQEALFQGIKLIQIEEGVRDFTVTDEYQSYVLHKKLIYECISYTIIPQETLNKEDLFGVFFNFKDQMVLYILRRGGIVEGSLIRHKYAEHKYWDEKCIHLNNSEMRYDKETMRCAWCEGWVPPKYRIQS